MSAQQPLAKDGGREQSTRLGVAAAGANHIVVGSFGDPRPMIMGIASASKTSPPSHRKNPESKATKRLPGNGHQQAGLNGSN